MFKENFNGRTTDITSALVPITKDVEAQILNLVRSAQDMEDEYTVLTVKRVLLAMGLDICRRRPQDEIEIQVWLDSVFTK